MARPSYAPPRPDRDLLLTQPSLGGANLGRVITSRVAAPLAALALVTTPLALGLAAPAQAATAVAIADLQGTGPSSPLAGQTVTFRGVVTAAYPTGGFNGIYVQTAGTGGATDATPGASDAVFVYGASSQPAGVAVGDSVEVTGTVSEFQGLTEVTPGPGGVVELGEPLAAVVPLATAYPTTTVAREAHEGELLAPTDSFAVTNVYSTNQYAEIGLATQGKPLVQPTEVARPGTAAYDAVVTDNAARGVVLDDGASLNFMTNGSPNQDVPLPWLSPANPIRVGAAATLHAPVILEWRNNTWKLQPTHRVTDAGADVATFEDTRPANAAPQSVGGDLKLGTFNVLNYFNTTGQDYETNGGTCSYYTDRDQDPVTVNTCTGPAGEPGPRGAAEWEDLQRQQAKIVRAINGLGADIVSLEELENSVKLIGETDRDDAIRELVEALNAGAGAGTWAYVASPAEASTPEAVTQQDVIRSGFIYKPAAVSPVGESDLLLDTTAFANAREPLAQAFKPAGAPDAAAFAVVVNHFKSKGDSNPPATGDNAAGPQGAFNGDRVRQAQAVAAFAKEFAAARGTDRIFLTGDFNAYSQEDPVVALRDAGFSTVDSDQAGDDSYSFSGLSGSLDHVLANDAAKASVTGADVWEINADESVAFQYSRDNYNVTQFYAPDQFAASDHNPELVGLRAGTTPPAPATTEVQVLATNDFHGRIKANGTEAGAAVIAGAVKQLKAENPHTVFAAAGDLIGASTFESFIAHDKPTIDALNSAGLEVSSVGNHEFDQGYDDLLHRVMAPYDATTNPYGGAAWKYLGANVHKPGAPQSELLDPTYVRDFDGVQVGFIGAVTEHLDELVAPGGMEGVQIEDVVTATNREADRLRAAGVDVIVLLVHEGAPTTDCAAMDDDPASDFGSIVTGVDDNVDAIVSGHTHLAYDCSFPVAGWAGRAVTERPVVSAGQYGYNLNQLTFTVDTATGAVVAKKQALLPLAGKYPADADTQAIVDKAVAEADVLGARPLGRIAGPFNRAKLVSGSENRGGESTLGNLVAEAQRWATAAPETGNAQIAFMNPGGLRADMVGNNAAGYPAELTYKQAATVQPFANTLVNMELTGAQVRQALEQQWQPAGASRPFLRLGTSKGFRYTYDAARPAGDRITGMWLDGVPVTPAATYSVTVNSFLATGGDNFGAFALGAHKADTGRIDLTAMVDYLATFATDAPLPVDAAQVSVGVHFPADAPAAYVPGVDVAFDLSSLAMSTGADPKDSSVTVSLGDRVLGTFPVDNAIGTVPGDEYGVAHVVVALPADLAPGTDALTVRGTTTGTVATVPVTVAKADSSVTATLTPETIKAKKGSATVAVRVASSVEATGRVEVYADGRLLTAGTLANGAVDLVVGPFRDPGTVTLDVRYLGDQRVAPSSTTAALRVVRGKA